MSSNDRLAMSSNDRDAINSDLDALYKLLASKTTDAYDPLELAAIQAAFRIAERLLGDLNRTATALERIAAKAWYKVGDVESLI